MPVENPNLSQTRNSGLRELSQGVIGPITEKLFQSGIKNPDIFTAGGVLVVGLGSLAAAIRNPNARFTSLIAATTVGLGSLMDAFDGSLARYKDRLYPGSVNFSLGQLKDFASDRIQESMMALSRMHTAHKRGHDFGKVAAATAAVTSPWPSLARGIAEWAGKPVPEGGKGIPGLMGTRSGRVVLGTTALAFPRTQPFLDTITTVSNIFTTVQRLNTAFNPNQPAILSEKVRKDARTRTLVAAGIGLLAVGATAVIYRRMRQDLEAKPDFIELDREFVRIIRTVEQISNAGCLDHRFVGGVFSNLLNPNTTYEIDPKTSTVVLKDFTRLLMLRPDGTPADLDMISFCPDPKQTQESIGAFMSMIREADRNGKPFPYISLEPTVYPSWKNRKRPLQLVTTFDVDAKGVTSLNYGGLSTLSQPIKPESIEPWRVIAGDLRFTTLNPIALLYCYELRYPSGIKRKDKEKPAGQPNGKSKLELLGELAEAVQQTGLEAGIDYYGRYHEWRQYIGRLQHSHDPLIRAKAFITGTYWDTVGTSCSHGSIPLVGRFLSRLSNHWNG